MSQQIDLDKLRQHRDALLLAEAIGWLHDYRKCSEEHLQAQSPGSKTQALPRTELVNRQPNLQNIALVLQPIQTTSRSVTDLLDSRTWKRDTLGQFLSRCHNTAHFDKQDPINGEQPYPGAEISTAFGFERPVATTLTQNLWNLPWNGLSQVIVNRQDLQVKISKLFSQTVADSRRPINEIDLWSWGSFVGALYKAALAGVLLTGTLPPAQNLQWRLLSIRVDGLGYISDIVRIPDLLARKQLLANALDAVRDLIEVDYPLGSEVYRDQDGSVFIVPDISNLLAISDSQGRTLQTRILEIFTQQIKGELLPVVTLEQDFWWGQDPNWSSSSPTTANDKLPDIKEMLDQQFVRQIDIQSIEDSWPGKKGKWEVCPVCRLRPMEEGQDACATCLQRRDSRTAWWQKHPDRTIWMDELADVNDRVALLVGKFGLEDWLSGDLVQTLLVKAEPNNPGGCTPKNPSPARLRRVWETCQRFWTETVEQELLAQHDYSQGDALRGVRQLLIPDRKTGWKENVPYDGTVGGKAISLLWREADQHFITISNLQWTGEIQDGQEIIVTDPGNPQRQIPFTVQGVMPAPGNMATYAPYLPLLASPDQFLALVPASDALEIADKIRGEYEKQFGKVQNRLPLFLGLVFFPRKLPLLATMDAARRMLETPLQEEKWTLAQDVVNGQVTFTNGEQWPVPVVMGDGHTPDAWYPYFFVDQVDPAKHPRRFQLRKAGDTDPQKAGAVSDKYANRCLVHVSDLRQDDVVTVTPSRFATLWLEHTAQRFAFDPQDALLLDELPRLMHMWEALKNSGITATRLRGVQALLESKGTAWGRGCAEFSHLTHTTLKEAGLFERQDKHNQPLPDAITLEDITSERLARCLELYLHILKQKI